MARAYRYPSRTAAMARLQTLEEYVARTVGSVHGVVCTAEADELHALRSYLGLTWDPYGGLTR